MSDFSYNHLQTLKVENTKLNGMDIAFSDPETKPNDVDKIKIFMFLRSVALLTVALLFSSSIKADDTSFPETRIGGVTMVDQSLLKIKEDLTSDKKRLKGEVTQRWKKVEICSIRNLR